MSDTLEEQADSVTSKEQDLRRAKEAIAGPVPLIPDTPDLIVKLPRGFHYQGVYHIDAQVRELNGADEEALARTKEFPDFFDGVLAHGTVRIGNFDLSGLPVAERQSILQTLLIGERERLFLGVIRATYGDEKTLQFTCGNCRTEQEVDLIMSEDLAVKEVDDLRSSYTYTARNGDVIEFRLANGADQMEALKRSGSTPAEQNTTILSRTIVKVNDGLVPDPITYARRMTMKDRRAILQELVSHQPGVELEVKLRCVRCQNEQTLPLGWADIFQA